MKNILLKFRRISVAVFAMAMVLSAFNLVTACPHFDSNNDYYMVAYDNQGYPRHYIYFFDYYLREIHMDPENTISPDYDTNYVLNVNWLKDHIHYEKYKLYLFESGEPSVNIFSYIRENKFIDANTKVVPISQNYYTLNVPISNTYKEAQEKKTPIEHTVVYSLMAIDVNTRFNKTEYDKVKNAVASTKFKDIGYKFLWVKPYMDYASGMEGLDEKLLKEYPEEITVTFKLDGVSVSDGSALKALAIDDESFAVTELGGTYNKADKTFTFKASKRGIYTVVANETATSSSPSTSSKPDTSSSQPVSSVATSSEEESSEVGSEIGTGSESGIGSEVSSEESAEESAVSSEASSRVDNNKGGKGGTVVIVAVIALVIVAAGGAILYIVKFKR